MFPIRHAPAATLGAAVSAAVLGGLSAAAGAGAERAAYEKHALPFFDKYCFECHDAETGKGDLDLEALPLDFENAEIGDAWNNLFAQIQFGEMPPAKAEHHPGGPEKAAFLAWLDSELVAAGRGFGLEAKLLLPDYANYIDHETLFDGSVEEMPYTPARLWRQRPAIYDAFWADHYGKTPWLSVKIGSAARMDPRHIVQRGPHKGKTISTRYFNNARFANPFYEFVHHAAGFTDYATIRADQASLEALLTNSETMAEILTEGLKVKVATVIKNKDSRHGNNEAGFVGGVSTNSIERRGRIPVAFKTIVDAESTISRGEFGEALGVAFELFLRRAPSGPEVEHYWTEVFGKNAPLGNKMALQAVLIYITLSPEFVYRMEIGMGERDGHGRRFLSPHELVYAIHHAFDDSPAFGVDEFETVDAYTKEGLPVVKETLTNGNPVHRGHSWLVEQMRAGELETREDVGRAVRRYLDTPQRNPNPNHNSPSVTNPRILQFFREYFGYHKAPTVFKDTDKFTGIDGFKQFHKHSPHRMVYDTDALVLHVLEADRDVLRELLTTNKVFASYFSGSNPAPNVKKAGGRERYAEFHDLQSYNLNPFDHEYASGGKRGGTKGGKPALLAPEGQRCGVLTQPSWLVAHSGNFDNDPVLRGKWIREKLLAGYVMDVPINVDAQVPDDEHRTLRQRFEVVRAEQCWRCHIKMNPLGMPFESYNHVGRYRDLELGRPVDASGEINFTGAPGLDGKVGGAREMMERIAGSDLARQSFLRHAFRYWMGRNEMPSDSKTLIAMDRAYLESGGSFKELLVALLTSDSFLYRK